MQKEVGAVGSISKQGWCVLAKELNVTYQYANGAGNVHIAARCVHRME